MAEVVVAGTPLHCTRRGGGEPLLLVQGVSAGCEHWCERFLAALEPGLELVAYDHRGIGRSGRVTEPFAIADLAADAVGLLDALGIEHAHVLGVSMGGMVAQELALAHPDRVRTLTLGCTSCGGEGSPVIDEGVISGLGEAMLAGDPERAVRTGREVDVAPGYAAEHSHYATWVEVAQAAPAPVPVMMAQLKAIAGHDASARLGAITAPTLVVHGTADAMLAASNAERMASLIPGARLELLDGAGHLFFWEQPERSAALVRAHALAGQ